MTLGDAVGEPSAVGPEVPTIVVPGFMKSGTTTIHQWLSTQPEFSAGRAKEPNFFVGDWSRGADASSYRAALGAGFGWTIDSSVRYLAPHESEVAAERISASNPAVRIIIAVRDPLERAVSHIRHDVRRGRQRADAAIEYASMIRPGQPYFDFSLYATAFRPYLARFDERQIAIIPSSSPDASKWGTICSHVGLDQRELPAIGRANRADDLASYTSLMRMVVDRGRRVRLPHGTPDWVRGATRRLLLRPPIRSVSTDDVRACCPSDVLAQLDAEFLEFTSLAANCTWPTDQ
jgi:hypothetical protein